MNCFVGSCWNLAHACFWQAFIINEINNYGEYLSFGFPPFYPPPEGSTDGCSCNLGLAFDDLQAATNGKGVCYQSGNAGNCDCCAFSQKLSAIPNICPGVDSNALGSFWNDNYLITSASAYFTAPPASCTSLLAATGTCTAILAEQTILDNAFSFYGPGQIPAGSLTPSDRATYASPSASTVVWTWVQPSQVLTAVMSPMTAGSNPSAAPVSASAFNPNPSAVPGSSSNSPTGSGISSASITPLASFAPSGSASPSPSPSPSPSSKSAGGAGIALIGQSVIAVVVGAGVIARMALA